MRRTLHPAVSRPQLRQCLHPPEAGDPQDFPPTGSDGVEEGPRVKENPCPPDRRPGDPRTPLPCACANAAPAAPHPPLSPPPAAPALRLGASPTLHEAWRGERGPEGGGVSGASVLFCSISGILAWSVPTGAVTPAPGPGSRLPKVHAVEGGPGARGEHLGRCGGRARAAAPSLSRVCSAPGAAGGHRPSGREDAAPGPRPPGALRSLRLRPGSRRCWLPHPSWQNVRPESRTSSSAT